MEVCRGLAYSHRRKGPSGESLMLIHQDINAFNVMVSYEAEVKIIDFGIAQIFLEAGEREGLPVAGKLIYFSPEQLQKKPLDRRVDIYGTGVLLYELLTGKRLVDHQETVTETVKKILRTKVQEEVDKSDAIPPELKPVLVKAMAFNPEDRYSWMEEMIEDLRAVVKKCSLDLDLRKFALYMREQFPREILLDRRRLTKLLLNGQPPRTGEEAPQTAAASSVNESEPGTAPQARLALSSWPFHEEAGFRYQEVQFFPKGLNVKAGKVIFRQGDPGTDIYVIVKGRVRLFLQLGDSRQTLTMLRSGDFFGETALLEEPYRSVSALAEEDCRLVSLDRDSFIKLFDEGLPRGVFLNVLEKLKDARSVIESFLLEDNLSRLIYGLMFFESRQYHQNGRDIDLEELLAFFRLPGGEQTQKYIKKLELLDALREKDKTVHIENAEKLESILNILSGRAKLVIKL
jgi:serine/threonine protein kinase